MDKIKIGVLREGKIPIDRRVPLTPDQAFEIDSEFDNIQLYIQESDVRCFEDADYKNRNVSVVQDCNDCEILVGVKEVQIKDLISGKTYLFFSHTIKAQKYNRELLQEILSKNIRLIDWECLTGKEGQRLIAFGRYAGIVGAYNGLLTYGKRNQLYDLRPAHQCKDLEDLKTEFGKVKLPAAKILITGGGRVSHGAMEVLDGVGIAKVSPKEILENTFNHPVYAQLEVGDYNIHKSGNHFEEEDFFANPGDYLPDFNKYAHVTDLMIAAAFWDPKAPVLFTKEEACESDFKIKVIADITCDIEGSIPSTKKASTIDDPIYDYNPMTDEMEDPFSNHSNITVMSVDNLPCELPVNSSMDFGRDFIDHILPALIGDDPDGIIERGTIAKDGKLTTMYSYLQGYIDGNA